MHGRQVVAMLLTMSLTTLVYPCVGYNIVDAESSVDTVEEGEDVQSSFLSCRQGDSFNITLDGEEVTWVTSNSDVASVSNNGTVYTNSTGVCELSDIDTGYSLRLSVTGKTSESSSVLDLDYSTGEVTDDVMVSDVTTSIEEVEINAVVDVIGDAVSKPDSFEVNEKEEGYFSETSSMTAKESGMYILTDSNGESKVVKVVKPELNYSSYVGAVGQETNLFVANFDTEVTYTSSDEKVATVDEYGMVKLEDGGECKIYVDTEYNRLECKITSRIPTVNTDRVVLGKGEDYQIKVEGNDGNLPVKYEIISGDGEVSKDGKVTIPDRKEAIVRVTIDGRYVYDKEFKCSSIHDEYWEAMQPAIEECLGTPYVFGGVIPKVGMDCSAYVSYVYRTVGLMNARLTAQGIYNISTETDDPQPGDLVFFEGTYDTGGDRISHIGIYAGDNMMYHSGEPNQKTSLDSDYWQSHLVGYGTMITEDMESPIVREVDMSGTKYDSYTQSELELIWAIVAQECNVSYDGALAVVTCAANRADINYGGHGRDVLSQLTAEGQFAYSASVSDPALWQARLGGNVPDCVKNAVADCLNNGARNHSFLNFRSNPVGSNSTCIGGNWYF